MRTDDDNEACLEDFPKDGCQSSPPGHGRTNPAPRSRPRAAAAEEHTRANYQAKRERRWQQLRDADPAFATRIEEMGHLGRALP
ncbi:hypothetical protein ACIRBY_32045 [Streptomyces sp. NPDC096136]|uniref:hypothetical protein n=1 Tax=Streptomyces sp. NPDC096136 TaxID=3366076 RepID=UPI00381C5F06